MAAGPRIRYPHIVIRGYKIMTRGWHGGTMDSGGVQCVIRGSADTPSHCIRWGLNQMSKWLSGRFEWGMVVTAVICAATVWAGEPGAVAPNAAGGSLEAVAGPFVRDYCVACHGGDEPEAEPLLEEMVATDSLAAHRDDWDRVLRVLSAREMPPEDATQPAAREVAEVVQRLQQAVAAADRQGVRDPGRVTIRRLNRSEYKNTIRELMGVVFEPAATFPADGVGYGFDNIGDVLSVSPLLMEKYLAAAETIAAAAIVTPESVRGPGHQLTAAQLDGGVPVESAWRGLYSTGSAGVEYRFPKDGRYIVRAEVYADQAGDDVARMALRIDGRRRKSLPVRGAAGQPQMALVVLPIKAGTRRIGVEFLNDFYDPEASDPGRRDRNLYVGTIEVIGPVDSQLASLPETHTRVIPQRLTWRDRPVPQRQVVRLLRRFASRAYRRGATDDEVKRLAELVMLAEREGDSFERGVQLAVEAVLASPSFLFRGEFDPEPDNPRKVHPIDPYELASRLSYFLWSSMPDDRLLAEAKRGTLREHVPAEVQRMLADERSAALVENFGDQWLQIRQLDEMQPDPDRFPNFDTALRDAMQRETRLFLTAMFRENRDIIELIDARFTFLNERLARHYGVPDVKGERFRRVTLSAGPRGGVLTQASVLTATSNPTRTSPVKRGKWILEQILADPPPPPPPGVQQLPEDQAAILSGSLRERFEQHRANPSCAICHDRMDPLGFALENFDAIGAWRDRDGTFPIDPSAKLPDGQRVDGPEGLKKILTERRDVLRRCLADKLLVYALGRGLEPYDRRSIREITQATAAAGDRLSDLVVAICMSDPFQMRRGDGSQ